MHRAVVSTLCPDGCVVRQNKTGKGVLSTREVCMGIQKIKGDMW